MFMTRNLFINILPFLYASVFPSSFWPPFNKWILGYHPSREQHGNCVQFSGGVKPNPWRREEVLKLQCWVTELVYLCYLLELSFQKYIQSCLKKSYYLNIYECHSSNCDVLYDRMIFSYMFCIHSYSPYFWDIHLRAYSYSFLIPR